MASFFGARSLFGFFWRLGGLIAVALVSATLTIRLTIHAGEEKTPNLVGMQLAQAERVAAAAGLGLKVNEQLFSDRYAAGAVASQAPAAGASTKTGQEVDVLVSLGKPTTTVPQLVGGSLRAAQVSAVARGLTLGEVATVHWSGAATDSIVAQDPPPSTQPARSPVVNLMVSLGEPSTEYVCPSFTGMTIEQARSQLSGAGFTFSASKSAPAVAAGANAVASGTILSQIPAPGSKIAPGASFNFVVAP